MNRGAVAGLQSERVDEGERAATHIPVPVPRLRVVRIHRGNARRVRHPPAPMDGVVLPHQEVVLSPDDVLFLAGEAAVAAGRGEQLPVRRLADRAPNGTPLGRGERRARPRGFKLPTAGPKAPVSTATTVPTDIQRRSRLATRVPELIRPMTSHRIQITGPGSLLRQFRSRI